MKKIIALLLLFTSLLASPFVIGIMTEQRIEDLVAQYRLSTNVEHIEIDIQRGWLHSEVISKVTMHLAELGDKNVDLTFHHNVRHGPVLWGAQRPLHIGFADVQSELILPLEIQDQLSAVLDKIPAMTLRTQLNYDGTQDSQLSLAEFHFDDQGTQIIIRPLTLIVHGSLLFDRIQGKLNWQGVTFITAKQKLTLAQSTAQIDMQEESAIWVGDMSWSSDSIQFSNSETTLEIKNINITAQTSIDQQKRISTTQALKIGRINHNDMAYGPATYTMLLNHIPLSVFEKLESIQNNIATLPAKQRTQAMQAMGFSMFSVLPDILAAEPEIEWRDILLVTPYGDVQGSLRITLAGLNERDMLNFQKIKQHLQADMQLQIPVALLSSNDLNKLDQWIEKGWLVERDMMLYSTLRMIDGRLTINDKRIPLPF
ncbi:MAG: DUF945 family protein [Mariprofundaceae bacterium]|nr:DUF945 family protein [Mariprofundaceae bacterium]